MNACHDYSLRSPSKDKRDARIDFEGSTPIVASKQHTSFCSATIMVAPPIIDALKSPIAESHSASQTESLLHIQKKTRNRSLTCKLKRTAQWTTAKCNPEVLKPTFPCKITSKRSWNKKKEVDNTALMLAAPPQDTLSSTDNLLQNDGVTRLVNDKSQHMTLSVLASEKLNENAVKKKNTFLAQSASGEKSFRRKALRWTNEEDKDLLEILGKEKGSASLGCLNEGQKWAEISNKLGNGRTAKQCRDRWFNHLRMGIKKGDWTHGEEELIKDMHFTFGGRWSAMAKVLKNRSENDIKNKWYSMKRKSVRQSCETQAVLRKPETVILCKEQVGFCKELVGFCRELVGFSGKQQSSENKKADLEIKQASDEVFVPRDWSRSVKV